MAETITSTSPDLRAGDKSVTESASGAIGIKAGVVVITAGSAAAMTLALPTAGTDDGKELTVVDSTGNLHTITTPANGVNGNKHVVTLGTGSPLAAAVGTQIKLVAYSGVWYVNPSAAGVTIS